MQDCKVCGRSFDPYDFQVVVPELGRGFDRIECAQSARVLAGPARRLAPAPLAAIVEPFGAALAPAAAGHAPLLRPLGAPAATLGLLAAGTAAAVVLWLRVAGADPTSFTLGRLTAPPAFGHETVQAQVEVAPTRGAAAARKAPERAAPTTSPLAAAPIAPGFTPIPDAPPGAGGGPTPGPSSPPTSGPEPSSPPSPARPPTSSPGSEPRKSTGKGHAKHGKGHYKHGETDGIHSPGHGHAKSGGNGHGKAKEHGKAESKGKGKEKEKGGKH